MEVPCCQEVSKEEFGESAGIAVRWCQRLSLVKVPCRQEVSEVEFGEGAGDVVRKCQRWRLVKVSAMLSGSVIGGV